jgi:hypothetical protein
VSVFPGSGAANVQLRRTRALWLKVVWLASVGAAAGRVWVNTGSAGLGEGGFESRRRPSRTSQWELTRLRCLACGRRLGDFSSMPWCAAQLSSLGEALPQCLVCSSVWSSPRRSLHPLLWCFGLNSWAPFLAHRTVGGIQALCSIPSRKVEHIARVPSPRPVRPFRTCANRPAGSPTVSAL